MANRPNVDYKLISETDVEDVLKLENQGKTDLQSIFITSLRYPGFPTDEAASLEILRYGNSVFFVRFLTPARSRQSQAPGLFLGAYIANKLVGYVSCTLSSSTTLTRESMLKHDSKGTAVCLHGVCIAPSHRRRKIGLQLLNEFAARQAASTNGFGDPLECIILITHEELRPFYEKAGFEWLGKSDVVHGSRPWYEMRKNLRSNSPTVAGPILEFPAMQVHPSESQQLPPGLLEVLQRPRSSKPAESRLYTTFPSGIINLIQPHSQQEGVSENKFDLLCPRNGCGSIILKKGVASWVERATVQVSRFSTVPIL